MGAASPAHSKYIHIAVAIDVITMPVDVCKGRGARGGVASSKRGGNTAAIIRFHTHNQNH